MGEKYHRHASRDCPVIVQLKVVDLAGASRTACHAESCNLCMDRLDEWHVRDCSDVIGCQLWRTVFENLSREMSNDMWSPQNFYNGPHRRWNQVG